MKQAVVPNVNLNEESNVEITCDDLVDWRNLYKKLVIK